MKFKFLVTILTLSCFLNIFSKEIIMKSNYGKVSSNIKGKYGNSFSNEILFINGRIGYSIKVEDRDIYYYFQGDRHYKEISFEPSLNLKIVDKKKSDLLIKIGGYVADSAGTYAEHAPYDDENHVKFGKPMSFEKGYSFGGTLGIELDYRISKYMDINFCINSNYPWYDLTNIMSVGLNYRMGVKDEK